jgi:hypothetical protein
MKVQLLSARASLRFVQQVGEIIDVSPAEAQRMISAGLASPVREAEIETAVVASARETTRLRGRLTKRAAAG